MKRFRQFLARVFSPSALMWIYPLTLAVPNTWLDITEYTHPLVKCANLLLPAGIYFLLASCSRNIGRTVLACFPLAFFAAFQIVLLFLYGESIIAVDMYLNLVTTNVSEATELLGNLGAAIAAVAVIYALPLVWAGILLWREARIPAATMRRGRRTGAVTTAVGIAAVAACWCLPVRFSFVRDIFPVNVVHNMVTAVVRTDATARYFETSAGFDYRAASLRPGNLREVYVLVVGETSRADNWQLFGYGRPTNPRLSARDSLVVFPKAVSESNTTHKSVPLALSHATCDNFNDSIYTSKSIVSAFNGAGYRTAWLSNQARNHSFIDFYAREAQVSEYLGDDGHHHFDHELIAPLTKFLRESPSAKNFIVLHTYGSHFNYNERYPADHAVFGPDTYIQASKENRDRLIDAYDNTILYTDAFLDSLISVLERQHCTAGLLYFSDHGEDIFDDSRERFLHSSPVPTYWQLHVPVVLWFSGELAGAEPDLYRAAEAHSPLDISSSGSVFDTMLDMAGITTPYADHTRSLVSGNYMRRPRRYLNDYNESVPLKASGLRSQDLAEFDKKHLQTD